MTNAAVQAMIETGIVPSAEALPSVAPLVREHMRAALPALTPELLWALLRCMSHFPSWKPDASGRVDNPPTLEGTTDGGLSFTQEQLHAQEPMPLKDLSDELDRIGFRRKEAAGSTALGDEKKLAVTHAAAAEV